MCILSYNWRQKKIKRLVFGSTIKCFHIQVLRSIDTNEKRWILEYCYVMSEKLWNRKIEFLLLLFDIHIILHKHQ